MCSAIAEITLLPACNASTGSSSTNYVGLHDQKCIPKVHTKSTYQKCIPKVHTKSDGDTDVQQQRLIAVTVANASTAKGVTRGTAVPDTVLPSI